MASEDQVRTPRHRVKQSTLAGVVAALTLTVLGVLSFSGDADDEGLSVEPPTYGGPPADMPPTAENGREILSEPEPPADMPPTAENGREILSDPWSVDDLSKRQARQVAAADRLQRLADDQRLEGFAGLAIEGDARAVILYWKGDVPDPVERLIRELRPRVDVEVRAAAYSLDELLTESQRIIRLGHTASGASIVGVGPLSDYSGLEVVLDSKAAVERGANEITSRIHLEFRSGPRPDIVPA
jgi:hypothetical protein